MRVAWSKGTEAEARLAQQVAEIIDLDRGEIIDADHVYLLDEEGGYLERYKTDATGRIYAVWEEGDRVAAWERVEGRFKILWKADAPQWHQGGTVRAGRYLVGENLSEFHVHWDAPR